MAQGWTWVSVPLIPVGQSVAQAAAVDVTSLLSASATLTFGDRVVASDGSSALYVGASWDQTIAVPVLSFVKVYVASPQVFSYAGYRSAASSTTLAAGWNWVAWNSETPTAVSSVASPHADAAIVTQRSVARWYDSVAGGSWRGTLQTIESYQACAVHVGGGSAATLEF